MTWAGLPQTWVVLEWGTIDGGILGATIKCVQCDGGRGDADRCKMCDGDGTLFQPYQLPNGAAIDLDRHAELLIQIEPPVDQPEP